MPIHKQLRKRPYGKKRWSDTSVPLATHSACSSVDGNITDSTMEEGETSIEGALGGLFLLAEQAVKTEKQSRGDDSCSGSDSHDEVVNLHSPEHVRVISADQPDESNLSRGVVVDPDTNEVSDFQEDDKESHDMVNLVVSIRAEKNSFPVHNTADESENDWREPQPERESQSQSMEQDDSPARQVSVDLGETLNDSLCIPPQSDSSDGCGFPFAEAQLPLVSDRALSNDASSPESDPGESSSREIPPSQGGSASGEIESVAPLTELAISMESTPIPVAAKKKKKSRGRKESTPTQVKSAMDEKSVCETKREIGKNSDDDDESWQDAVSELSKNQSRPPKHVQKRKKSFTEEVVDEDYNSSRRRRNNCSFISNAALGFVGEGTKVKKFCDKRRWIVGRIVDYGKEGFLLCRIRFEVDRNVNNADNVYMNVSPSDIDVLTKMVRLAKVEAGARIAVYWPEDDIYYPATVLEERKQNSKGFHLQYDDGQREWINLWRHQFELLDEEPVRKRLRRSVVANNNNARVKSAAASKDVKESPIRKRGRPPKKKSDDSENTPTERPKKSRVAKESKLASEDTKSAVARKPSEAKQTAKEKSNVISFKPVFGKTRGRPRGRPPKGASKGTAITSKPASKACLQEKAGVEKASQVNSDSEASGHGVESPEIRGGCSTGVVTFASNLSSKGKKCDIHVDSASGHGEKLREKIGGGSKGVRAVASSVTSKDEECRGEEEALSDDVVSRSKESDMEVGASTSDIISKVKESDTATPASISSINSKDKECDTASTSNMISSHRQSDTEVGASTSNITAKNKKCDTAVGASTTNIISKEEKGDTAVGASTSSITSKGKEGDNSVPKASRCAVFSKGEDVLRPFTITVDTKDGNDPVVTVSVELTPANALKPKASSECGEDVPGENTEEGGPLSSSDSLAVAKTDHQGDNMTRTDECTVNVIKGTVDGSLPVKRGRGRPPKKKNISVCTTTIKPVDCKSGVGGSSTDDNCVRARESFLTDNTASSAKTIRKIFCGSSSGSNAVSSSSSERKKGTSKLSKRKRNCLWDEDTDSDSDSDSNFAFPDAHERSDVDSETREIHVGSRVSVYWPDDRKYYKGTVTKQRKGRNPFYLEYDDGDNEWIDFEKHRVRILHEKDKQSASSKATKTTRAASLKPVKKQSATKTGKSKVGDQSACTKEADIARIKVGTRVAVWWPDDRRYYNGIVTRKQPDANWRPFFIEYDDDEEEWIDFRQHKFRILSNDDDIDDESQAPTSPAKDGASADPSKVWIGSRLSVWWPEEKEYFDCTVTRLRDHKRPFYLEYDDGDREWIDLDTTKFVILNSSPRRRRARIS